MLEIFKTMNFNLKFFFDNQKFDTFFLVCLKLDCLSKTEEHIIYILG